MTIRHPPIDKASSDKAFVFAELLSVSCSICAPVSWSKEMVEAFARETFPGIAWQAVDISKLFGVSKTPNPCNQAPKLRQHWFLLREGIA